MRGRSPTYSPSSSLSPWERAGVRGAPEPEFPKKPFLAGLRSAEGSGAKFLDVRRLRSRLVSKNSADREHRKLPEAKRRDTDCGSPFLCLLSFGEAKESELLPATPGNLRKEKRYKFKSY